MRTLKAIGVGLLMVVSSGVLSGCYGPGYYGPRGGYGHRHWHRW